MANEDYDYEWDKELEEFEKTKAGVKGLVDSGVKKLPKFFINKSEKVPNKANLKDELLQVQIPVIDIQGIEKEGSRRQEIIEEIREASHTWGFFQMINHGIPLSVIDAVLESTRRFHEQPKEAKMELYSSEGRRSVRFYSINGRLRKPDAACWRDSFACTFMDDAVDPEVIPLVCRSEITEYMKYMMNLRDILSEILSKALGLSPKFLEQMQCMKSEYLTFLYYPTCPEPDKTFGAGKHSDSTTLTVLIQDCTGGLQIHHENNWVDVPPVPGALIVNIGDFLQLITNDKFKSVEHRVLPVCEGSRVAATCYFYPHSQQMFKAYGPIKELVSEDNPPLYREVNYVEFVTHKQTNVREGDSALTNFKLIKET